MREFDQSLMSWGVLEANGLLNDNRISTAAMELVWDGLKLPMLGHFTL